MKNFSLRDTLKVIIGWILYIPCMFIVIPIMESMDYFHWKHFGKHEITGKELEYNKKIEIICKAFDEQYAAQCRTVLQDDNNLMMRMDIPYSLVKQTLSAQFDIVGFSEDERKRAMKEVNRANAINGPEYEFAIGGRSECFLLQTRLRETKYEPDQEPHFFWG